MKVHGLRISPFVRKVLAVLELKALPYEHVNHIPRDPTPEFLAMSPLGKIPAFEDGALKISDSTVICEYLEEQYPTVSTLPKQPADRARARWLEEYADTKLIEVCGPGLFFERFVKPKFLGLPPDAAKVEDTIANHLPPALDFLEQHVPASGFIYGELGRVDVSVVGPLINAEYADYFVDAKRWPKLAGFVTRVKAAPVMKKLLSLELG
jgi:glutathione S-transferase